MLRKDMHDLDENGLKGDWAFMDTGRHGLMICVQFGEVRFWDMVVLYLEKDKAPASYPVWEWNGNRETPTLSPSILVHGVVGQPARWHGYLREGELETLEYNPIRKQDSVDCDGGEGQKN